MDLQPWRVLCRPGSLFLRCRQQRHLRLAQQPKLTDRLGSRAQETKDAVSYFRGGPCCRGRAVRQFLYCMVIFDDRQRETQYDATLANRSRSTQSNLSSKNTAFMLDFMPALLNDWVWIVHTYAESHRGKGVPRNPTRLNQGP